MYENIMRSLILFLFRIIIERFGYFHDFIADKGYETDNERAA